MESFLSTNETCRDESSLDKLLFPTFWVVWAELIDSRFIIYSIELLLTWSDYPLEFVFMLKFGFFISCNFKYINIL